MRIESIIKSFFQKTRLIINLYIIFGAILLLILSASIQAQQHFKTWTTAEGLPQNNVISIAQTTDGYLWVATVDGLARFDGFRFKVFNKSNTPELPNNRIFSMFTDTAGRLWLSYPNDQMIVVYENGIFKTFEKGRDFEKDEDIDPRIRGYQERLRNLLRYPEMKFRKGDTEYIYENGQFVARQVKEDKTEFPSRVFTDLKNVWIDEADAIYQLTGEKPIRYPKNEPLPVSPKQVCPVNSAENNGTVWFSTEVAQLPNANLFSFKDGQVNIFRIPSAGDPKFDAKGNLWIQIWNLGLFKVDAAMIERNDPAKFFATQVSTVQGWQFFRDRDNNLWSGSQEGLRLINPDPLVTVYSQKTGLPAENIYPVIEDAEGTIWFGAWDNKLINYRDGKFSSQYGNFLTSLFVDSRSRLWTGNWSEIKYCEQDKWVPVEVKKTLPSPLNASVKFANELSFVTEDKQGVMWFGYDTGLVRYNPDGSQFFTTADGLPSNFVTSYLLTRAGEFWIGTSDGIARLENGRFHAFTEKDGLAGNYTRSFYEDADGTIWIGGYDGGLTRYKNGIFTKITKSNGLFSDGVFVILEDDQGWFWMNSNPGIFRVRRQELNDFAEGKISSVTSASYGPEDGLLNVEGNGGKQPAGLKAKDGKLWFPMAHGIAVIDPKTVKRASEPPPLLIEEVRIDQKAVGSGSNEIRLNSDQIALEIDYTSLSYVGAERVRFRYRLEGLEETWTEADTRRTAYFSHLPPGNYTFRVIAANYDGVWNNEGAAIKLVIVPPFYRQWWFYGLVALVIFGFITTIYLVRLRQLTVLNGARAEFARRLIESQEDERRRIALELHDSIGQTLAVIRNRTMMGLENRNPEKAFEQLQEISEVSNFALSETRAIAHNLHPAQIENLGLTTALQTLVKSVENSSGMKCEVEIHPLPTNFPYEISINLYRISQECLANILKHSDASFARVSLLTAEKKITLIIEDDGRGFNPVETSTGLGLTGIRERSKMIGADLIIDSQPGEGTKITLSLK